MYAQTVFHNEQRLLAVAEDVSSKYARRTQKEFEKIAAYIQEMARGKKGNYMVFFPSYKMMHQVWDCFTGREGVQSIPSANIPPITQNPISDFSLCAENLSKNSSLCTSPMPLSWQMQSVSCCTPSLPVKQSQT